MTPGPSTLSVHGPGPEDDRPVRAAVIGPVHHGVTYPLTPEGLDDVAETGGEGTWYYSRLANPTTHRVAQILAALEGAETAELFASGMAALGTALTVLVPPGGHLVAAASLYGDTDALLREEWAAAGRRVTRVEIDDHDGFARALADGADALFVESVSNPMLRVADLPRLAALARDAGAVSIVDGTFAPPVNLRACEAGFDVVVHSATKYLNGHSDVTAGVVAGRRDLVDRIRPLAVQRGATLDPAAAFLLERGLKTLALRMARHNENGLGVARWLAARDDVATVAYPLLEDHPDHALARTLLDGGGGMVSLVPAGDPGRGRRLVEALGLIVHAASLGGVESLACLPELTSHAAVSADERARQGIAPGTVRLSLGIEDLADLIADLDQALAASAAEEPCT